MKAFMNCWTTLAVLALFGCATTSETAVDTPEPATSGAAATTSEADAATSDLAVAPSDDPASASPAPASYYSEDQADRGRGFFRETCLSCHASSEFRGRSFQRQWQGRTVRDLYASVAFSMPDDNPGGLPAQTYTDVIAYILELNRVPAGDGELTSDRDTMRALPLWPDGQQER